MVYYIQRVRDNQTQEDKMNRQYSKTTVVSIARSRYLVSQNTETPNGFIVKTTGFDKNGNLETESLKNRSYRFVKSDAVLGNDAWIRVFETEEQAENEIDEICK